RREHRVPRDLSVVVRVNVDPARRDEQVPRVDLAPAARAHRPDGGDPAVIDRDVRRATWSPRAVDDRPVANHQVVHIASVRPGLRYPLAATFPASRLKFCSCVSRLIGYAARNAIETR